MRGPYKVRVEVDQPSALTPREAAAFTWDAMRNPDTAPGVFTVTDRDGVAVTVDFDQEGGHRSRQWRATLTRMVVKILAVEADPTPLDCCDEDSVHVWVVVPVWANRRAVLVQGTQFVQAAGCAPEELPGKRFYAELPKGAPAFVPEPGERIVFHGLEECPPFEEIERRLGEGGSS